MTLQQASRGFVRLVSKLCTAQRRWSYPMCINQRNLSRLNSPYVEVLGRSSVLLQDGLDIKELPLVIRRMGAKDFPYNSVGYSGEGVKEVTEEDKEFRVQLQGCSNVRQVLKLLEIPGEQVTPYSACFALQRLSQLSEGSQHPDGIDSFIKQAIFNELCETATKDIETLSAETVILLVKCYLNSNSQSTVLEGRVNEEVEKRIGDGTFSILEVCTLITLLSENIRGSSSVAGNLWIHLGNRYLDINPTNIAQVYATLRNIGFEQRFLFSLVDKQFAKCWWKLTAEDMSVIVRVLTILNHDNLKALNVVGKWISLHGHDLQKLSLFHDLVTMYTHFSFGDGNFVRSLELFVPSNISKLDKVMVAMVMEYCLRRRIVPQRIFDCVATDFIRNSSQYKPHEVFYCLRPFGRLNYLPENSGYLFSVIENKLMGMFNEMSAGDMVELLASFTYLGRLPVNFVDKVFTPHFISRLQSVPDARVRAKAAEYLIQLRTSILLEYPKLKMNFVNWEVLGRASVVMGGRWHKFHMALGETLVGLLRSNTVLRHGDTPRHVTYFVDYEIWLDAKGKVISQLTTDRPRTRKLAIITVLPEHCTLNSRHLVGEHAMKSRHLAMLGYTVLEVHYEDYMWKCRTQDSRDSLVRHLLHKHITFS